MNVTLLIPTILLLLSSCLVAEFIDYPDGYFDKVEAEARKCHLVSWDIKNQAKPEDYDRGRLVAACTQAQAWVQTILKEPYWPTSFDKDRLVLVGTDKGPNTQDKIQWYYKRDGLRIFISQSEAGFGVTIQDERNRPSADREARIRFGRAIISEVFNESKAILAFFNTPTDCPAYVTIQPDLDKIMKERENRPKEEVTVPPEEAPNKVEGKAWFECEVASWRSTGNIFEFSTLKKKKDSPPRSVEEIVAWFRKAPGSPNASSQPSDQGTAREQRLKGSPRRNTSQIPRMPESPPSGNPTDGDETK